MTMHAVNATSGGLNYNPYLNREFEQNVASIQPSVQHTSSVVSGGMSLEDKMNYLLENQDKLPIIENAHQAYAQTKTYASKGAEWDGIAFPPSDGNGNFVPVVAGGDCGNKFDSTAWLEGFGKV